MLKRIIDIVLALLALLILLPLFLVISMLIVFESNGGAFYSQTRIGKNERPFKLYKFRSMRTDADKKGLLTVGGRDPRITKVGYFLRKYKLDELPQLWNILKGDMSIVGPRPEVKRYVDLYSAEQKKVLQVRPGLTDYASLQFINENELLAKSDTPEKTYIETIMPQKLDLNLQYIEEQGFGTDMKIILKTVLKIVKG